MIGYKVVINVNGKLLSPYRYNLPKYGPIYRKIEYIVGEYVSSPLNSNMGPLCLFSNIEQCYDFLKILDKHYNYEIYQCEYVPSQFKDVWNVPYSTRKGHNITNKDLYRTRPYLRLVILADKVKLIELVRVVRNV